MTELQTLVEKVQELERRVGADLRARQRTNRITFWGGALLFFIVLGYFSFIHKLVIDVLEPRNLASLAASSVEDYIPKAAKSLQEELERIAPDLAAQARIQAVAAFPKIRQWLEDETVAMADRYIVSLEREMDTVIQQGVVSDSEAFGALVKDPDNPEVQKRFREVVHQSIRSYFDEPSVADDLKSYTDILKAIDAKFKRLREGKELTAEEELERNLIVAMRELAARSEKHVQFKP